jgi:hypothetical protein
LYVAAIGQEVGGHHHAGHALLHTLACGRARGRTGCIARHAGEGSPAACAPRARARPPAQRGPRPHPPMACCMLGSASSMCAGSTTAWSVLRLNSSTKSSSMSLLALRRDPWSTMTMPVPEPVARQASSLLGARLPARGRWMAGPAPTTLLWLLPAQACAARRSASAKLMALCGRGTAAAPWSAVLEMMGGLIKLSRSQATWPVHSPCCVLLLADSPRGSPRRRKERVPKKSPGSVRSIRWEAGFKGVHKASSSTCPRRSQGRWHRC